LEGRKQQHRKKETYDYYELKSVNTVRYMGTRKYNKIRIKVAAAIRPTINVET